LDEEFDAILHMEAAVGGVFVVFMESIVLCFNDPLPLLRWSLWWLDASFRQIGYSDLSEVTVGSFAFPSSFAFLLFLLEGLFWRIQKQASPSWIC
jgi:hypothetical protein